MMARDWSKKHENRSVLCFLRPERFGIWPQALVKNTRFGTPGPKDRCIKWKILKGYKQNKTLKAWKFIFWIIQTRSRCAKAEKNGEDHKEKKKEEEDDEVRAE